MPDASGWNGCRMPDAGCRWPDASGGVGPQGPGAREKTLAAHAPLNRHPASGIWHPHLEFLRDAHHFIHRSDAVANFSPAVLAQVAHAVAARGLGEDGGVGVLHDELADLVVHVHHLEDAHAR